MTKLDILEAEHEMIHDMMLFEVVYENEASAESLKIELSGVYYMNELAEKLIDKLQEKEENIEGEEFS